MTTPEYVVDKATKLETIYDRINTVDTHFEVLKRDAIIDSMQQKIERLSNDAGADCSDIDAALQEKLVPLMPTVILFARAMSVASLWMTNISSGSETLPNIAGQTPMA